MAVEVRPCDESQYKTGIEFLSFSISTNMHLISFSILLIQVTAYALPTNSLSISRREDPKSQDLKTEKEVTVGGNNYTATPLPEGYQCFDEGFKLQGFKVGGKPVPALLYRFDEEKPEGSDEPDSNIVRTIANLKRPSVDLHLFSERRKTDTGHQVDIVVKDLRESDPPLKPFDEWYAEDESISAINSIDTLYKNVKQRLLWYAEHEELLYESYDMGSIFVQKEALNGDVTTEQKDGSTALIMPAYWEPSDVNEIRDKDDAEKKKRIEEYKTDLARDLEPNFGVDKLEERLEADKLTLRRRDVHVVTFENKEYELLQIKHMRQNEADKSVPPQYTVYSIVGGFIRHINEETRHYEALMIIFKRGNGPRRIKSGIYLFEGGAKLAKTADDNEDEYIEIYEDDR